MPLAQAVYQKLRLEQMKGRGTISLTLENNVIALISEHPNRSALVNDILKERLMTEEGIAMQIEETKAETKEYLASLKKKLIKLQENRDQFLDKVPEELKRDLKPTNNLEVKTKGMKEMLKAHPNKLNFWTELMNKRFHKTYTPKQFKKIVEVWG